MEQTASQGAPNRLAPQTESAKAQVENQEPEGEVVADQAAPKTSRGDDFV